MAVCVSSAVSLRLALLVALVHLDLIQGQVLTNHYHYYYNELTGEVQLETPEHAPDTEGDDVATIGTEITTHPGSFVWVPIHNDGKTYYFNQETKTSQWERPADLSWRRIDFFPEED